MSSMPSSTLKTCPLAFALTDATTLEEATLRASTVDSCGSKLGDLAIQDFSDQRMGLNDNNTTVAATLYGNARSSSGQVTIEESNLETFPDCLVGVHVDRSFAFVQKLDHGLQASLSIAGECLKAAGGITQHSLYDCLLEQSMAKQSESCEELSSADETFIKKVAYIWMSICQRNSHVQRMFYEWNDMHTQVASQSIVVKPTSDHQYERQFQNFLNTVGRKDRSQLNGIMTERLNVWKVDGSRNNNGQQGAWQRVTAAPAAQAAQQAAQQASARRQSVGAELDRFLEQGNQQNQQTRTQAAIILSGAAGLGINPGNNASGRGGGSTGGGSSQRTGPR